MDSALPVVVPPLAAVLIALMSAGLAWAVATPLVRAADSPTLPERLLRWAGQHRFIALLAYLPALFSGRHAVWALPVAWLGLQITTHRVRRRVFGDTWSFAGQVWWNARAFLAMWTWWWMLIAFPTLLVDTGVGPVATIALGVVLLVWLSFYNDVLGAILGAKPIVSPALLEAFEPILAKARIRRPRLVHAGPRGGLLINAFALGALRGDVVLFFDGLLDEMTPAESAAVLAHEIGHLEDFAARRWQVYSVAPLLVAGSVAVTLAVQQLGWPSWVGTAWCSAPLFWLLLRATRSQQRENESDARAVELCGDGEALIRALTTIHSRSRMPRRFHPRFAEHASHPSLARRIQAIRAVGGVPPAPIEASIVVTREFAGGTNRLGWLLPDLPWRSVLERIGGTAPGVLARSRLALDCYGPSMTSASATCLARTGDDTFVWEVPADAGSPRPLAALTGRVVGETYEERALLVWHEQDLLMLWRGTNRALRIARGRRCRARTTAPTPPAMSSR
jgi:Zn-dependent protease with chaperone function